MSERILTEIAQDDRNDFIRYERFQSGCSCFLNPPCCWCTHPGNPRNQEDESCWIILEQEKVNWIKDGF